MSTHGHSSIPGQAVGPTRDRNRGFILLASLVAIMALTGLIVLIQVRAMSNQRLAARLTTELTDRMAKDAIYDRLRGLISDQMVAERPREDRPFLNGAAYLVEQNARIWRVSIQDQASLVDIYLSSQEVLERILPNADSVIALRKHLVDELGRFPRVEMTLARLDIDSIDASYLTQSTASGTIRVGNSPTNLAQKLAGLSASFTSHGQVIDVRIRILGEQ